MNELTISYGLLAPQSRSSQDSHILPITKILYPKGQDQFFLTCSRDGSIIKHTYDQSGESVQGKRMQAHSDWVTDIIQVCHNKFITVSHDFSIVLLTLHDGSDTWETKIIGDHEDYIKCVVHVPADDNQFVFTTGGLDKKVKVWKLENDEAILLHEFLNCQSDDTGSIYTMTAATNSFRGPFDLIVGDCNGDLIFYSCKNREEIFRLTNAHSTNIKVVEILNDSTRLISSCSDGLICIWDLSQPDQKLRKLASFKWDCSIWRIDGSDLSMLYIGDSKGRITKANLLRNDKADVLRVYDPAYPAESRDQGEGKKETKHGGILDLIALPGDVLMFAKSTDSNLYKLRIQTRDLQITRGGFALTKSSLLTNRRHVITENTKGEIQRWDIVICELLNTFDISEGDFDEVVAKYTSKEVLSHWCTVSVKVGMLFVKINSRILNTEIYGSALEDYRIVNDVDLNPDERYNLGKIVINSLFNEFVSYEMQKDKTFRKQLSSKKKDNVFSHKDVHGSVQDLGEIKSKDKRRKSAFYRFGSATPTLENNLSSVSAPNTPLFAGQTPSIPVDEQPLLPPPATSVGEKSFNDGSELGNLTSSKNVEGRTLSSGSLITRKLRLLRPYSNSRGGTGTTTPADSQAFCSDVEDVLTEDDNPTERIEWNQAYSGESLTSQLAIDTLHAKLKPIESSSLAPNTVNSEMNTNPKKEAGDHISDFFDQLHEGYKHQYNSNSSSLKLLSRRLPETKIIRDPSSPIVRIRNGVLLVVHDWGKSSCGGRVLFSTYLPASRNLDDDSNSILQENEEEGDSNEDDGILDKYDLVDNEYGNGMNRRQIFEQLEDNLPFWFAEALFCDTMTAKQQPKLNFIITPWQNHTSPASPTVQTQQPHHRLKFGRSKSSDIVTGSTELPKIADSNVKLIAPGMIKVKKIKVYIVDRFETKTPEMKAKIDPSEWIELLCKNQVLDNDMTLSTVRTLYWKSQSDIIFEYRRKLTGVSASTANDGN